MTAAAVSFALCHCVVLATVPLVIMIAGLTYRRAKPKVGM
jgi:hypothetical protein